MAYKTIATRWLLAQKSSLDVSFIEHKDIRAFMPNVTDIEVKISISGVIHSGRGTHPIGDLALEKASSEAIERWCCHKLRVSTVGCAIHSIKERAELNARSEFLERFLFDQFFSKTISTLSSKIDPLGPSASINFYELTKTTIGSVVLALVFDSDKPICLGLALEENIEQGFRKASIEALRNYSVYKSDRNYFLQTAANDHNLWCCDSLFLKNIAEHLKATTASNQSLEIPAMKNSIQPVSEILRIGDCPLYFSRTIAAGDL